MHFQALPNRLDRVIRQRLGKVQIMHHRAQSRRQTFKFKTADYAAMGGIGADGFASDLVHHLPPSNLSPNLKHKTGCMSIAYIVFLLGHELPFVPSSGKLP
jgi:hypothetical protein